MVQLFLAMWNDKPSTSIEEAPRSSREHMLTGMLLHVIVSGEAAMKPPTFVLAEPCYISAVLNVVNNFRRFRSPPTCSKMFDPIRRSRPLTSRPWSKPFVHNAGRVKGSLISASTRAGRSPPLTRRIEPSNSVPECVFVI